MQEEVLLISYQDHQGHIATRGIYRTRLTALVDVMMSWRPEIRQRVIESVSRTRFCVTHISDANRDQRENLTPINFPNIDTAICQIIADMERDESRIPEFFDYVVELLENARRHRIREKYTKGNLEP